MVILMFRPSRNDSMSLSNQSAFRPAMNVLVVPKW